MRVLIACEFSGVVRDAFAAKGHDAWSCDLLPSEKPDLAGDCGGNGEAMEFLNGQPNSHPMKRPLYTELESALCMAQNDSGNLHCALNDILNDQVTWFRRGDWRVGTCRENGPAGGLVIVRQLNNTNARGYASVYLWEDWFPQIRDNAPSHTDKEGINLRNAALEAHLHMMKCQMPETRTA